MVFSELKQMSHSTKHESVHPETAFVTRAFSTSLYLLFDGGAVAECSLCLAAPARARSRLSSQEAAPTVPCRAGVPQRFIAFMPVNGTCSSRFSTPRAEPNLLFYWQQQAGEARHVPRRRKRGVPKHRTPVRC